MKQFIKFRIALCSLAIAGCLNCQNLQASLVDVFTPPMEVQLLTGDGSSTFLDNISDTEASEYINRLVISYSNNKLEFSLFRILSCNGETLRCYVKKSDNVIWIYPQIQTVGNRTTCADLYKFTSTVEDIEAGDYTIITDKGAYQTTLKEGQKISLGEKDFIQFPSTLRADAEWVLYNPGDFQNKPEFVRIRCKEQVENDKNQSFAFKFSVGEFINSNIIDVPGYVLETDQGIYSNFALSEATRFPSIMFGIKDGLDLSRTIRNINNHINYSSVPNMTYDFYRDWLTQLRIDDVKVVNVEGEKSLLLTYKNGLEYLIGVGPIGDHYSSNIIAPSYDLPKGTVPTHFLYMRSLVDNHIIYGDPTLDPSYVGGASVASTASDDAWVDTAEAFGIRAAGEATVTVYALNGQCVAAQTGRDEVLIPRSQLDAGIYLVRCSAPGHLLTRKLTLP